MSDKKHPRNTKGNPDYGFAFKEHGETKIVKVEKYKCMEYDENANLIKINF